MFKVGEDSEFVSADGDGNEAHPNAGGADEQVNHPPTDDSVSRHRCKRCNAGRSHDRARPAPSAASVRQPGQRPQGADRMAGKGRTGVHVSLEATGIYSLDSALALHVARHIEVAVLNPKMVNRFAQTLHRSKTDAADAQVLAEYRRRMLFMAWQPPIPSIASRTSIYRSDESPCTPLGLALWWAFDCEKHLATADTQIHEVSTGLIVRGSLMDSSTQISLWISCSGCLRVFRFGQSLCDKTCEFGARAMKACSSKPAHDPIDWNMNLTNTFSQNAAKAAETKKRCGKK